MKEATLYKKLDRGMVLCTSCRHYCKIPDEGKGICGVRINKDGSLLMPYYGMIDIGLDPIEKKPLYHFLPGSLALSIGTIGCNFKCSFCQNAWIAHAGKDKDIPIPNFGKFTPKQIVDLCVKKKIKIIAYTYTEPSIYTEFNLEVAKLAQGKGIKNVYVSNGYTSKESLDMIGPYLDAINIDLKSFSDKFYQKECGANLEFVLENIKEYYKKGIWVEITTLIIPGKNNSDHEMEKIVKFIKSVSKDIPWHISRFFPNYKMIEGITSEESLKRAYSIGKDIGLNYIYIGNMINSKYQNTWCPKCNNLLIYREKLDVEGIKKGLCPKCGMEIAGVWKNI